MKLYTFTRLSFLLLLLVASNSYASTALHQVAFTSEELKNIQGHYSSIEGYIFIRVRGKQVSTNYKGKYIQLIKKSNGRIYPIYRFLRLFPIDLGEFSFSFRIHQGKKQIVIHRNKKKDKVVAQFKAKAIPTVWRTRLGKYKTKLLKGKSKIKEIALRLKNGVLVAFINKNRNPYPLLALSSSEIITPSTGYHKDQRISISFRPDKITLKFSKNTLLVVKI